MLENIYYNVAILSGLEPHRTILQKKLTLLFSKSKHKSLIIQGKPQAKVSTSKIGNVTILSHIDEKNLAFVLQNATNIYCRSGYSTLMDLYALGITKAILIPTPGQTEQEYLAEYFQNKGFEYLKQDNINK